MQLFFLSWQFIFSIDYMYKEDSRQNKLRPHHIRPHIKKIGKNSSIIIVY